MLRSMSMYNFINFINPQRLTFDEGINFIIGGNSSGKTAIFELIRRSLSSTLNTSASSIPHKDILAYTICHFVTKTEQMPSWEVDESISSAPKDVIVCLFVPPVLSDDKPNKSKHCDDKANSSTSEDNGKSSPSEDKGNSSLLLYYKMFIAITTTTQYKIFIQQIRGSAKKSFILDSTMETTKFVEKMLENKQDSDAIRDEMICSFFLQKDRQKSEDSFENESMNLMFNWLSGAYVGILPMRSIGPLQWTRSTLIDPRHKEDNYIRACSQAEILMELLDNDETKMDWVTAKKYRTHLVHPYEFRKEGNRIVVYNRDSKNTSQLLKIPDGVVEAEQLILLLSERKNLTLTIEEPDRGMHPQMINRLRDLVLKRVVGKTVLVVSHHPSILDHFTLNRTYICASTKSNEGKICHDVIKFPEGYTRYGIVDELKASLFSKRVLFVEGYTDQIIVEAIFDVIINENNNKEKKIEVQKNLDFIHYETYKEFISSLHVIDLKGCGNGKKGMEFCGKIKRESYVLYDFDVIGRDLSEAEKATIEYQTANPNNFVWIGKDLEDVIDDIESKIVDSGTKEKLGIPIIKQHMKAELDQKQINNLKARWKAQLHEKLQIDIKYLAIILIKHSQEFQRFLLFLKEKMPRVQE